jgi:hypothetical protein
LNTARRLQAGSLQDTLAGFGCKEHSPLCLHAEEILELGEELAL